MYSTEEISRISSVHGDRGQKVQHRLVELVRELPL
jgi:hypothetical protein